MANPWLTRQARTFAAYTHTSLEKDSLRPSRCVRLLALTAPRHPPVSHMRPLQPLTSTPPQCASPATLPAGAQCSACSQITRNCPHRLYLLCTTSLCTTYLRTTSARRSHSPNVLPHPSQHGQLYVRPSTRTSAKSAGTSLSGHRSAEFVICT